MCVILLKLQGTLQKGEMELLYLVLASKIFTVSMSSDVIPEISLMYRLIDFLKERFIFAWHSGRESLMYHKSAMVHMRAKTVELE